MVTAALHRRVPRGSQMVAALIVGAGKVIGFATRRASVLPGLCGAAMVSVGLGEVTGHIFGHGLAPWISVLAGGWFFLAIDRQAG